MPIYCSAWLLKLGLKQENRFRTDSSFSSHPLANRDQWQLMRKGSLQLLDHQLDVFVIVAIEDSEAEIFHQLEHV